MRKLTKADKEAINGIESFKSEVYKMKTGQHHSVFTAWMNKAGASLRTWLGDKNDSVGYFVESSLYYYSDDEKKNSDTVKKIDNHLSQLQEYIRMHGVIKEPPTPNWFYRLSNLQATTLATVTIAVITWLSVTISSYFKTIEYLELKGEHKALRDSLRISAFKDAQIESEAAKAARDKAYDDSIQPDTSKKGTK